jgi:hypothetical protein
VNCRSELISPTFIGLTRVNEAQFFKKKPPKDLDDFVVTKCSRFLFSFISHFTKKSMPSEVKFLLNASLPVFFGVFRVLAGENKATEYPEECFLRS